MQVLLPRTSKTCTEIIRSTAAAWHGGCVIRYNQREVAMESTQYGNERRDESTVGLVRGILEDVQTLTSKELTAAKLEIKQEITEAIKAAVAMGLGGFVSAIAFILLTLMIVLLLERYTPVPLWGSFGIVGLVYGIIGGVLIWRGKNRAADVRPYPQETVQSAKEDVRYLKQRAAGH